MLAQEGRELRAAEAAVDQSYVFGLRLYLW